MWWRVVVTLCTVVGIATASTGRSPLESKPEKFKDIDGCYISTLEQVIPVGEEATSPDCILYTCEKQSFSFYTCGKMDTGPNCTVTTDSSKPYPDCCPIRHCDDESD